MENDELIMEAIQEFEKFNGFKINDYISDECEGYLGKNPDSYIGNDTFYKNIQEWMDFFDEKDKHILLKLLKNYRYYPEGKIRASMKKIVKTIKEENDCDWKKVYFITFPSKEGVKSGGDDLRSILQVSNLGKIEKENIISDTDKNIEKIICKAKVIVFIDDIVGSGTTLYGNVKKCIEDLELEEHKDIKLYIAILFGRKKKIKEKIRDLQKLGVTIEWILMEEGKKCFDEAKIFSEIDSQNYKKIIRSYEEEIKNNSEDEDKNYVLGFEENQFLVSLRYNTPNNTLSSFWKPSRLSVPLFIRTEYIRPTIDDIKKEKEKNQRKAYILAEEKHKDAKSE